MASMSAYVSRQTEGGTEGPLQLKECIQRGRDSFNCVQQREGPLQLKECIQRGRDGGTPSIERIYFLFCPEQQCFTS